MYLVLPPIEKTEKLPIYPCTIGLKHLQGPMSRPNGAYFHHIFYVSSGEGLFDFNGIKKTLHAGSAIFIKKAFPVEYRPASEDFKTSWLTFDGIASDALFEYFGAEGFAVLNNSIIETKIAEMYSLIERNTPIEILSARTYSTIVDFFTLHKHNEENALLEQAKRFIRENYRNDMSVENISSSIGISQSLLFKLFRLKERSTPMDYLRTVRVEAACKALADSSLKISEIGALCGFSDTSYFCKIFKEQIGESPTVYRKNFMHW